MIYDLNSDIMMDFRFLFSCLAVLAMPKEKLHSEPSAPARIYFNVKHGDNMDADSVTLSWAFISETDSRLEWVAVPTGSNKDGKWEFQASSPILIRSSEVLNPDLQYLVEPGDSITCEIVDGHFSYFGKGSEKINAVNELYRDNASHKKPSNPMTLITKSLEDFEDWNRYLDARTENMHKALKSIKPKISAFAYDFIKASEINKIESSRVTKFSSLIYYAKSNSNSKIGPENLCHIFDSTLNKPDAVWLRKYTYAVEQSSYLYNFSRESVRRDQMFDFDRLDKLNMDARRKMLYLEYGERNYKGLAFENFMLRLLTRDGIKEHPYDSMIVATVKKYKRSSKYLKHVEIVEKYEKRIRKLLTERTNRLPEVNLLDLQGNRYSKENLRGKVGCLIFWSKDNKESLDIISSLPKIQDYFKDENHLFFITISSEKDTAFLKSEINRYHLDRPRFINLYTEGEGEDHEVFDFFNVEKFPAVYIHDRYLNIALAPEQRRQPISMDEIIECLQHELALWHDGPYIKYVDKEIDATSVFKNEVYKLSPLDLQAQTDRIGRTFNIKLKYEHKPEPSEYEEPEKMIVLSDIEGNFDSFRQLLQANQVIDKDFDWVFGDGHLVFCGDMFDRGQQVTECLWLIYTLEEKARLQGGYVHFILGNHEIMNLSGDTRYIHAKYRENERLLNTSYTQLFNIESELGRWLRSKNVIEKIGNKLFVHGGIGRDLNNVDLSLETINQTARLYYDKESIARASDNVELRKLFSSNTSPFWSRDYYKEEIKVGVNTVDSTLNKFKVSHIITGHTVVADTISVHFGGKVFNTDTKHQFKKSEALFIKDTEFYRTDLLGNRKRIYPFDN